MDKETLHEAANRIYGPNLNCQGEDSEYFERAAFIAGAGWQARSMYSKEEVIELLEYVRENFYDIGTKWHSEPDTDYTSKELLKQFKNKQYGK